jgi:hypothetical protein
MEENNHNDDSLFEELLGVSEEIEHEIELQRIADGSMIELKSEELFPIYDEYYKSLVFDAMSKKGYKKPKIKDPKGGLTAAGRAYFKKKEGANLKPGVRGAANTPDKMRRKGSFLTRFFTNPSGPMKDDKGRATRLALSAAAWGEPVPQNAADAAKLAAKGRRLLERYSKTKKKSEDNSVISAKFFNPTHVDAEMYEETLEFSSSEKSLQSQIIDRIEIKEAIAKTDVIDRGENLIPEDDGKIERMIKASKEMAIERRFKARSAK